MAAHSPAPARDPARRPAARLAGWARRGLFLARAAVGLGVLGVWAQAGLPAAWEAGQAAAHTPAAAGLSYDAQRATLPEGPLVTLLAAARRACPPAAPVLALSDDPIAWQQGNYLLYPRRLDVVQSSTPFGAPDLAAHAGGCLFFYGPQGGRLDPFRARLAEVACSPSGCLYRVLRTE